MGIYSCICKVSTTKMTSIMNPDVPFEMTFPHGNLHPGACIMIHGTSNHGANRFNINFEKLATQEHVFHFDFRFDQRETVSQHKIPFMGTRGKISTTTSLRWLIHYGDPSSLGSLLSNESNICHHRSS